MDMIETRTEAVDWPAEFDGMRGFEGLPWREVRPGFWQADYAAPHTIAVAAVCPTDRQWVASVVPADLQPHHLAQLSFTLHDAIAERLRAGGWTVGCAGPDCTAVWPCPKREMHDFMGAGNGGEAHTPIGTYREENPRG
jgi:hypothetical protein